MTDANPPVQESSGGRRRWWIPVAAVAVLLGLAFAALHAPPVRRLVAGWVEQRLARAGIDADIGELRYGLIDLDVELRDLRLQARGADQPFLVADRLYVDLPWSVVSGDLSEIQAVELEDAVVRLLRDADGRWNLPLPEDPTPAVAGDDAGASGTPLPSVGRVTIRRTRFGLDDAGAGIGVLLPALSFSANDLTAGGRLGLDEPATVTYGGREMAIEELGGRIAWNGDTLGLDEVTARTSAGRVTLDGTLDQVASGPAWAVDVDAAADIGEVSGFLGLDDAGTGSPGEPTGAERGPTGVAGRAAEAPARPAGALATTGRVEGPLTAPTATLDLTSERIAWRGLELTELTAELEASPALLTVDSLEARVAGARVTGSGELRPGEAGLPGSVRLRIDGVDVEALATAWSAPGDSSASAGVPAIAPALDATLVAAWTSWPGADLAALTAELAVAFRERPEAPGLPLAGSVRLTVDGGDWRLRGDPRLGDALSVDAAVGGRLASPVTESTLGGRLEIEAARLTHLAAALGELGGSLPDIAGTGRVELALHGTLGSPGYRGPLELRDLRIGPAAAERLGGILAGVDRRIGLEDLRVVAGPDEITGDVGIDLDSGAIRGRLAAVLPRPAALLPGAPASAVLEGRVTVEAELGGVLPAPELELTARSRALLFAGQPALQAEARASYRGGTLRLDELIARQSRDAGDLSACRGGDADEPAPGCMRLRGTWDFGSAELDFRASARAVELSPPEIAGERIPLSGTLDIDAEGSLVERRPRGTATLEAASLEAYGRVVGPIRVRLTGTGEAVEVEAATPELGTTLDGRLSRDGPWELRADMDRLPLERLLPDPGPDRRGRLTATLEAGGHLAGDPVSRASLRLGALEGTFDGGSLRLLQPGTVELAGGGLRTDGLAVGLGEVTLRLEGSYPAENEALVATLSGDIDDLEALLAPDPTGRLDLAGAIDARLELRGTVDAPRMAGRLSVARGAVALGDIPPFRDIDLELALEEGAATLQALSATWQGAPLTASGRLPLGLLEDALAFPELLAGLARAGGAASLEVRAGPLTAEALRPFLPAGAVDVAEGRLIATASLTAEALRPEALRGEVVLEEAEVTVAGARLAQRAPTRVELVDGRAVVRELRWGGAGTEVVVTGSLPLSPDGALDLQARGDIDLRVLQLLVPGTAWDGTGVLAVDLSGTTKEPRLDGSVDVQEAELRIPAARLIVRGARGRIALDGQTLAIEPVAGELNGGAFVVTGTVPLPDPTGGRLDLTAVDVAMQPTEGLRSLLDADLVLNLEDGLPGLLSGTITVTRGSYRERMSLVGQVLDRIRGVGEIAGAGTGSTLDDLRLDLRIVTEESFRVENNLANLALTADLDVTGTLGAPGLTGRAELLPGGTVFLSGNRFRLQSGSIDFTSVRAIEPEFDLTAVTRTSGYELTLRISGTPEEPQLDLSASPPLPQSDVASLLLTGRRLGGAEAAQTAVAQEQLLGLLASEFTGRLAQAVGLDSVRLERGPVQESFRSYPTMIATETDPTQRLTVSKELRPDLELIFSQALGSSGGLTWLVNYELLRGFEIQTLFDDDANQAYQFGHQFRFGGGEGPARPAGREVTPRVSGVTIEGDSPLPRAELREVLELEQGDRFDFFRWQDDRDRLAGLHRERGYLEARVDTARESPEGGATSVRLSYTIRPGPRTVVTARGIELGDELRRRIEEAWVRSVLDDFLLQEASEATRLHLAGRGFVTPTVEASIDQETGPGEKRLVLEVDPGPLAADRRVEVTGNRRLSAERIRSVLDGLDPPETAWARPRAAGDAISRAYAQEGMPDARVEAGPPRLRDGIAVLPVEIDEGPLYRVGEVAFSGLEAIPVAEAEAILRLATGDPWVPTRVSGSRRALEALYRTRGYSRATVRVETPGTGAGAGGAGGAADRDSEIDIPVTFRVDEGPLETVASIEIRGAEVTNPGVIDRALTLGAGDALDRDVLARARKRLYDTGAFRRVDITVEPSGPPEDGRLPVRLLVSVSERPPYRFRYGLRLNSMAPLEETASREYKLGLSGDLTSDNLLGRTISAGVSGRWQPDFQAGRAFVTTPRLFGLPLISSVFVLRSRESFAEEGLEPFLTDVAAVTLEQRFSPFENTQVAYSYSFERNHTFEENLDPQDPFAFDLTVDISRLATSGVIDTRDDPFDATRGLFHSSQLEYAASGLGSDLTFAKYLLQQYWYRPLGAVTLASAARFGVAAALGDQQLIRSERFFAGGGNSVRGYAEDSLGPTGFFGDPSGGNALLELKQEVRFPIAWRFRGVGFVDAGNVFRTFGDISLAELKVGAGLGLRVDTPFALLRVDYGLALIRDPGDPRGRFFFSIGQAF